MIPTTSLHREVIKTEQRMQIKRITERTGGIGYDYRVLTTSVYKKMWYGWKLLIQYTNTSIPVIIPGREYGMRAATTGYSKVEKFIMQMNILVDKRKNKLS